MNWKKTRLDALACYNGLLKRTWLNPMVKEPVFSEIASSFQHGLLKNVTFVVFNVALLNTMVSQLLVELPRTLKGQSGVEFDFQSI